MAVTEMMVMAMMPVMADSGAVLAITAIEIEALIAIEPTIAWLVAISIFMPWSRWLITFNVEEILKISPHKWPWLYSGDNVGCLD